jgi:transcriptional regulator with XRE-family HTH domain
MSITFLEKIKKMQTPCYITFMNIHSENSLFGKNLKRIRENLGLTQSKLSELSGVSRRTIVHYEKHVKRPSIDKVKKISAVLGVTDEELLGTVKISDKRKINTEATYRIMKRVRIIEQLPKREQDMIFSMINTLAQKHGIKNKL